jgi:hypothetical protein
LASREDESGDLANYRRKLKGLLRAHDDRLPDGRSAASVEGGRIAGRVNADSDPSFGAKLAAHRWGRDDASKEWDGGEK